MARCSVLYIFVYIFRSIYPCNDSQLNRVCTFFCILTHAAPLARVRARDRSTAAWWRTDSLRGEPLGAGCCPALSSVVASVDVVGHLRVELHLFDQR